MELYSLLPMGYAVSISLDCAIHNVVKSKNRKPKWWETEDLHFHYVAYIKGHQFKGKTVELTTPTYAIIPAREAVRVLSSL